VEFKDYFMRNRSKNMNLDRNKKERILGDKVKSPIGIV